MVEIETAEPAAFEAITQAAQELEADFADVRNGLRSYLSQTGYASDKGHRLLWRVRPQFERDGGRIKIYSRFLVTDKPDLPVTEAA